MGTSEKWTLVRSDREDAVTRMREGECFTWDGFWLYMNVSVEWNKRVSVAIESYIGPALCNFKRRHSLDDSE